MSVLLLMCVASLSATRIFTSSPRPNTLLLLTTFSTQFIGIFKICLHTSGCAVGRGIALQAGRSRVRFPIVSLEFFHFGRTMALGLTQSQTEISTRNISWGVKAAGA